MLSNKQRRHENRQHKRTAELALLESHGRDALTTASTTMTADDAKHNIQKEIDRRTVVHLSYILYNLRGNLHASDIQSVFLYTLLGASAPMKPNWVDVRPRRLVSHQVLIVVRLGEGVEEQTVQSLHATLRRLGYGSKIAISSNRHNFLRQFSSVRRSYDEVMRWRCARDDERRQSENQTERSEPTEHALDPRPYMLTEMEMIHAGYPFPILGEMTRTVRESVIVDSVGEGDEGEEDKWAAVPSSDVETRSAEEEEEQARVDEHYTSQCLRTAYRMPTHRSPVFAVDCEMCNTTQGPMELTRISVVDEQMRCVFDTLVRPPAMITDYLTQYSGITKSMMKDVRTTLPDVRRSLAALLPEDAVLVGHTFNCDLKSMHVAYPFVIDISLLYNLSGRRTSRTSLSTLASIFLRQNVQSASSGHCSIEDAVTTMKLWLLKRTEGLRYGNIMNEWNYNSFAAANGLNIATAAPIDGKTENGPTVGSKRRFGGGGNASFDGIDMKRVCKMANHDGKTSPSASKMFTCLKCQNMTRFTCRSEECCCREMSYVTCAKCPSSSPSPSTVDGQSFDWRATLQSAVDATLLQEDDALSPIRSIERVMEEHRKKYRVFEGENEIVTQSCVEKMLELDVAVLNLNLTSHADSLSTIEDALQRLLQAAAPRALLGCAILSNGADAQPSIQSICQSVFCLTVKK